MIPRTLRFPPAAYALIAVAAVLTVLPYREALSQFIDVWNLQPEYSHGMLIPFLSGWLIWRRRDELRPLTFTGSWTGLALIAAGALLALVGDLATIWWIVQYGFLLALYGVILALVGGAVFRRLWVPLALLVFMIPLPAFFNNTLSLQLQLISSQIGVAFIRLAGISVFLEGNVIDLGKMQLQVAEACSGLRYLFPLMTLAFVMAYLFQAPLWRRISLFLVSIPISILMNSLRIGAIGIACEYWGESMAEGLLHDFEGWAVFMVSTAAMVAVAALLKPRAIKYLRDAFVPEEAPKAESTGPARQPVPRQFVAATVLLALAAGAHFLLPARAEISPTRAELIEFPTRFADWRGERSALDGATLDALKLDDYLMSNYRREGERVPVNFYVAWYGSQRSGRSVHSPRACLPGGGWQIQSFDARELKLADGRIVPANRAVIELGGARQIVYYWFDQRGRRLTNEYLVKWYIFWDALTRNRSDGALVRITAPVLGDDGEAAADQYVREFAAASLPLLTRFVPD